MATFTLALKDVITDVGGVLDFSTGTAVMTGGDIGLAHYPIFDEGHRPILNGRIIDHFLNREIGQETVGMWKHAMQRKMNEIMPFFNKLYLSTLIEFDPLSTVNLHTISTGTAEQEGTSAANSEAHNEATGLSRTVNSDTPQVQLNGDGDYATGLADVTGTNTSESTGTQSNTDNQNTTSNTDSTTTGYQGAAADLLMRYRESIINVDISIINELEKDGLFMLVWDNGDTFYNNQRGILI